MYFVDCFNFANLKTIVLAFIRNSREQTLSSIFSERLPLSWFKVKFIFTLTITASVSLQTRQNLTIFFATFLVKVTGDGVFLLKLLDVFLPTAILRDEPLLQVFLIFDKKCRSITFRWILLFIAFTQVVFREKVCFIETTSFNYSFTETWSIQRNPFCRFLLGTHH